MRIVPRLNEVRFWWKCFIKLFAVAKASISRVSKHDLTFCKKNHGTKFAGA
jgi:hypothetical protein